ncbi:MAG: WD40 repeat domain-containing protein [Gemmataceae bacterium]
MSRLPRLGMFLMACCLMGWGGSAWSQQTDASPKVKPLTITQQPLNIMPGAPLSNWALVTQPPSIRGALSWTIESQRHRGQLVSLAVKPDGRQVATAGIDGTIRIWDLTTGELERALVGHNGDIRGLAWSHCGAVLASAGRHDNTVRLWDTKSGQPLRVFRGFKHFPFHVAWSRDNWKLAAAGGTSGWVWRWDADLDDDQHLFEIGEYALELCWSPDSKQVAVCSRPNAVQVVDWQTGKLLRTVGDPADMFLTIDWSPTSNVLAAGNGEQTTLWDMNSGKVVKKLSGYCSHVTWSPNGKQLATIDRRGTILLWDVDAEQTVAKLPAGAFRCAWSADGQRIVAISAVRISVWDVASSKMVRAIDAGSLTPPLWTLGRPVVHGIGTPTPTLWDTSTGQLLHTLEGHTAAVNAAAWSRDGKILATGGADKTVRLWDGGSGKLLSTLEGHTAAVTHLAWSPDARTLASGGSDMVIRLWDTSGKLKGVLQGHKGAISELTWSPTGSVLASGDAAQNIHLWNSTTLQPLRVIEAYQPVLSLAWSPSGKTLACGTRDDAIRLYNAATGQSLASLSRRGSPPTITSLTWLPNGFMVFSGRGNYRAQLWDIRDSKVVHDISAMAAVSYVGTAMNGNVLVTATNDRTVRFWETNNAQLRCSLVAEKDHISIISVDGHYRAPSDKDTDLIYVVQTVHGQETLKPAEFAARAGWKNNPARVNLLPK